MPLSVVCFKCYLIKAKPSSVAFRERQHFRQQNSVSTYFKNSLLFLHGVERREWEEGQGKEKQVPSWEAQLGKVFTGQTNPPAFGRCKAHCVDTGSYVDTVTLEWVACKSPLQQLVSLSLHTHPGRGEGRSGQKGAGARVLASQVVQEGGQNSNAAIRLHPNPHPWTTRPWFMLRGVLKP